VRKLLTLAAAACAAAALLVTPAGAITGNYVEDFDHPFVGLVAFYDDDGEFMWRCSGSLISPTVFVTAGHCTDQDAEESPVSARIWFRQDAGDDYDPETEFDADTGYPDTCITDDPERADDICVTSDTLYDYGFDNFAGFPNHRDLGIVVLDTPVQLSEYGVLPSVGLVDRLGKKAAITSSGYGVTDWDPVLVSFRERLMANSYIVHLHNNITSGFGIQSAANPAQGKGGTCNGDSGGPVFQSGTNIILAVTSWGWNGQCKGLDFSYRLDQADVLAWIASHSS
jgi:secreted trypsin-like serine protease